MALLYPRKPLLAGTTRFYPGNIYARPALAPYYEGLRGFGQARRTSTDAFSNTLRSFATTPFAVNSQSYMEMIRERYGLNDRELQNALGTVGGVVGAGIGGLLSYGARLKTIDLGPGAYTFTRNTKKVWEFGENTVGRRIAEAGRLRPYSMDQIELIQNYNKINIDRPVQVNNLKSANEELTRLQKILDDLKLQKKNAVTQSKNFLKKQITSAEKAVDAQKIVTKNADDALKILTKQSDEALEAASKAGVKAAAGLIGKEGSQLATRQLD